MSVKWGLAFVYENDALYIHRYKVKAELGKEGKKLLKKTEFCVEKKQIKTFPKKLLKKTEF